MLTAEKAFLCLSMFNTVRLSMTLFFPFAISQWGEMRVSINRIQDFLVLEEREEPLCDGEEEREGLLKGEEQNNKEAKGSVSLQKVTGRWRKEEEDTLTDITMEVSSSQYNPYLFQVQPSQLVAIIGPVGSGKSSVLQVCNFKGIQIKYFFLAGNPEGIANLRRHCGCARKSLLFSPRGLGLWRVRESQHLVRGGV